MSLSYTKRAPAVSVLMNMRHSFRITIPTVACVLIALQIPTGIFLWRYSAYKAVRQAIEAGDEETAIRLVQRFSGNRLFKPDWTISAGLPNWNWLHELDGWMFGCPTCRGNGCTLLQYAATRRQPHLAKTLLAAGASVNLCGDGGAQVLTSAVGGGDTNIVAMLIARGADPNSSNYAGPVLHVAAGFARQPEVIELLLNAGANLNGLDSLGRTPLDWAMTFSNRKSIACLTARGALPSEKPAGAQKDRTSPRR